MKRKLQSRKRKYRKNTLTEKLHNFVAKCIQFENTSSNIIYGVKKNLQKHLGSDTSADKA